MIDPQIFKSVSPSGVAGSKCFSAGGLFQQKRDSITMLTPDPLVVAQLNQPAAVETRRTGLGDGGSGEGLEVGSRDRERLRHKIDAYNQGMHRGTFTITQTKGRIFEGALRFYYEDGNEKTAKAIWLGNQTTVDELMPRIREKFNISDNDGWRTALYQVQNQDEIHLAGDKCPLDIAVSSKHNLRFILRMEPSPPDNLLSPQPVSNNANDAASQHKSLSQFFGVERGELAMPYYARPAEKAKPRTPSPKANKKLSLADSASLGNSGSTNCSSSHLSVGFTKRSQSVGNLGNGGMPGLVLKTEMPNFIRKFQSSEGTFRNFVKKDRGNTGRVSSKGLMSPKKRSRAKSLSNVFERGFTFHKKEESSKLATEVSAEDSSPGLLKIFGDKICPNATYKSVLASEQSSAVALIKVVLERYSLPVDTFGEYVLCDVIGNYKTNPEKVSRILGISEDHEEKQEWVSEFMRVLGDDERPLAIKSYWKPEVGFARRFEIRRRADISAPDVDTITQGINLNAKRLQMPRAHRAMTDASLASLQEVGDAISKVLCSSSEQEAIAKEPQRQLSGSLSETESSDAQLLAHSLLPPPDFPYLLTLHGDNPESDQLLYLLDDTVCLIGCSPGTNTRADIKLHSTDINQEHCRILMLGKSSDDNKKHIHLWDIFAEPVGESKVLLNGILISQRTKLNPEDIIGIGGHYLFLLKNPLARPTVESSLMRLLSPSNQSDFSSREMKPPLEYASPRIAAKAQEFTADSRRLKLSYPMRSEDKLLKEIASLLPAFLGDDEGDGSMLSSLSYLLCMCIEHSAYNFDQERTKQLMMKVATLFQTLAWDKTKAIARNQPEKPSDAQTAIGTLLPDLRVIVCLLTNALEILNFLQTNMGDYVAVGGQGQNRGVRIVVGEEVVVGGAGIEDEALVELKEVVMYAFQQTVYYLTKTLYISIPNFLDTNPFTDDDDMSTKGMDSVLSVFQMTFDLMRNLDVHPEITSQLFAYLLFFTNASLFNMLVERGSDGKFYEWSKGAQIRGNLDVLETWIQDHDLQDQSKFLTRVSMVIDLIATPKVQLMQADWSSLHSDFHELNTMQLHHVLSHYQLGASQSLPAGWQPPPEEMKSATDTENLLESFDNHPALALPNHGFKLDLRQPMSNRYFLELLQELKKRLPCITFKAGTEGRPDAESSAVSHLPAEISNPEKKPTNPVSCGDSRPVPPPRIKSCGYPQSDQDTKAATAPDAVKLAPTEGSSLSDKKKMSPRVLPKPRRPGKANGASKSDGDSKIDSGSSKRSIPCPKIVRTDADNNSESQELICVSRGAGASNNEQPRDEDQAKNTSVVSSSCPAASLMVAMEPEELTRLVGRRREDAVDSVFVVDLEKGEEGVGLGLIDGIHTQLRSPGIYIGKLVPSGSAMQDGRLIVGDRILAVNGTSLVGGDYKSAMKLFRTSGKKVRFLIAKSEPSVALKITASIC